MAGPIASSLVNIAKNAAASAASKFVSSTASNLRSGINVPSSATSKLQDKTTPSSPILLYPSDVDSNPHGGSYILFARHDIIGATIKPRVDQIFKHYGPEGSPGGGRVFDQKATDAAQKISDASTAANPGAGSGEHGNSPSIMIQRRNIQRTGRVIGLYMPPAVNVSYNMDYSAGEIGVMGEVLYDIFSAWKTGVSITDSIKNSSGKLGTAVTKTGIGIVDKIVPGVKDLYAIETGTMITPRTEMMFRGIGRREFAFTFVFIPKSRDESNIVKAIVQEFKVGMTPTFKDTGNVREMTIPDIFSIQYMHTSGPNKYLNKIGKCYLKSMNVTYGGDKFITYDDDGDGPPPQRTTIALSFQEIEIMDRDAVENRGY